MILSVLSVVFISIINRADLSQSEVELHSSDFPEVVASSAFVDKTHLLNVILTEKNWRHLFLAHKRMGKTTLVSMMKHFLSEHMIGEDQDGKSRRREMFEKLEISSYPETVKKHFGVYTVMHVELSTSLPFFKVGDDVRYLSEKIHAAFFEHKYLTTSPNLSDADREVARIWCNATRYKNLSRTAVVSGIAQLARCLYHYNGQKKVIALLDDYDSPLCNALDKKDANFLDHSIGLDAVVELVETEYLHTVLMTGVLAMKRFFTFRRFKPYPIFHLGLTENEVDRLFRKFNVSDEQSAMARFLYGGYIDGRNVEWLGHHEVYNLNSILIFLESTELDNYWAGSNALNNLRNAFGNRFVEKTIRKLTMGQLQKVDHAMTLNFDDLALLNKLLVTGGHLTTDHTADIFYRFLGQTGYLTRSGFLKDTEHYDYRGLDYIDIPNGELRCYFCRELEEFYKEFYQYRKEDVDEIEEFIHGVNSTATISDVSFKKQLEGLQYSLESLLRSFMRSGDYSVKNHMERIVTLFLCNSKECNIQINKRLEKGGDFDGFKVDVFLPNAALSVLIGVDINEDSLNILKRISLEEMLFDKDRHIARRRMERGSVKLGIHVDPLGYVSLSCKSSSNPEVITVGLNTCTVCGEEPKKSKSKGKKSKLKLNCGHEITHGKIRPL